MINYRDEIRDIIAAEVELPKEDVEKILEIPQDKSMGDYAFPCFRLAKVYRKAPQMIAADLADKIRGNELFEKVEQVNAYVNMFIDAEAYTKATLAEALDEENF